VSLNPDQEILPCFDLALALIWEGTRREQPFPVLTKPWLARSTKAAEGAVDEGTSEIKKLLGSTATTELLGEAVSEIPGVGFLLKRIGHWAISGLPLQNIRKNGSTRCTFAADAVRSSTRSSI
jgi:hypothetical protein